MKKRLALFLFQTLIVGSVSGTVLAQHDPAPSGKDASGNGEAATDIVGSAAEMEAYRLLHEDQLLTARTKAEAVLESDPDSIVANFVVGEVLRQAEGDLSRAMYRLGRARELFENKWGKPPSKAAPWKFHRELLYDTQLLAGEMEEWEYQLEVLDYSDALYDPAMIAEHAWPLLQLGRYDEARAAAQKAIASTDPQQQSFGRNILCAVEGELRTRKPYYDACLAAYDGAKAEADAEAARGETAVSTSVPVNAFNAAMAAYAVLQYDDVERLAKEASKSQADTVANPWRLLGRYYTDSGRVAEAVPSMREMNSWRAHEPASLRDQDHADTDAALSTLLLVAGETDAAGSLVDRAIASPDRRGLVSEKADQAVGAHALLRRAVLRTAAEQAMERASWSSIGRRAKWTAIAAGRRAAAWPDEERVRAILTDDERLDSTFRPYLTGGLEPLPTWLAGDLVDVVGAGVAEVVLARGRDEDKGTPGLAPYYDAYDAEVALAEGDDGRAVAAADRATKGLPKSEALLAARTAAIGAEAARKAGDDQAAMRFYALAMQKDGGAIRRLGLSIPAVVRAQQGDPTAQRAGELLARSPRLREDAHGFVVTVERIDDRLRACLRGPDGAQLACGEATKPEKPAAAPTPPPASSSDPREIKDTSPPPVDPDADPDETWEEKLARAFHREVFALTVGLTSTDLNSLDGSTTVASQAQREQMKGILKGLADDPSTQ